MAINISLLDSENQNWDFQSNLGLSGSSIAGLAVVDGQNDTFDNGLLLGVNATGINPLTASLDFGGREINTLPFFTPEGIAVTRSILVSDATISPVGFARFFDSFTNTTNADLTFTVSSLSNSGADSGTTIRATSSGDTALGTADFGFVLDDADAGVGDSAWGYAYGDGRMLLPTSATLTNSTVSFIDLITVQHTITLKAGETKSLLSFAVQNDTAAHSVTDYARFTRSLNEMRADNFLAGLSEKEISQVQNYAYIGGDFGTGPAGLTALTDGEGNRWGVNNQRMGVQTLSTDALRDFHPGEILYLNLTTNRVTTVTEDGQEATFTGSLGGRRTGYYSVMASPEDGFVRVMLRVDYSPDADGPFVGPYGLNALMANAQNLVGDRNVNGTLGDGTLTLGDGGVVIDDSVSGGGGTRPALTFVFGDTTRLDAQADNNTEEQVSLSGTNFTATDGPPLLTNAGDTFALLYYIAVNDDGLGGVADLAKLIRPDYKALAGLSAFEVSKIRNFTLTEADRLKTTTGDGNDNTITGDYWGDDILGGAGNDILIGLGSADFLRGEGGNDSLLGGISEDELFGGAGEDLLDGGTGADLMNGEADNDIYIVDNAGDRIRDTTGQGVLDWVATSVSYSLVDAAIGTGDPLQIELLSTTDAAGTAAINLTGDAYGQRILGNDGQNTLDGKGGGDTLEGRGDNDLYYVDNVNDLVIEAVGGGGDVVAVASAISSYALAAGQEVELLQVLAFGEVINMNLNGNAFGQQLFGSNGVNILDGKGGTDILQGFGGNDDYYLDSTDDQVFEVAGGGTLDRVFSSASFTLGAGQEVEWLATRSVAGTTAINLSGNTLAQRILGNNGVNVLDGKGGTDILQGFGGNDDYYLDSTDDQVLEAAGGGTLDRVFNSASFTLAANQEIEWLATRSVAGTTAINLTGNTLAQTINGNNGVNLLIGYGGADTLFGQGGNDRLYGGAGNDILNGGTDFDVFAFNTALDAGTNVDTIQNYSVAQDTIWLDDAIFTGLALGTLAASAFTTGAAATDTLDRIVYNAATGALLFDADGSNAGAAIQFATLGAGLAMANTEFVVV